MGCKRGPPGRAEKPPGRGVYGVGVVRVAGVRPLVSVGSVRAIPVVLVCAICAALSGLRGANTAESQAPALNHATRDGARHSRDLPSKTELANRFADIKRGSWQIRATAAKFVPLPP
jgi:hypothetical protein